MRDVENIKLCRCLEENFIVHFSFLLQIYAAILAGPYGNISS